MAGKIYVLNDCAELVAMEETAYDSEKLLQELLAKYADLLAGDQINPEPDGLAACGVERGLIPRRW